MSDSVQMPKRRPGRPRKNPEAPMSPAERQAARRHRQRATVEQVATMQEYVSAMLTAMSVVYIHTHRDFPSDDVADRWDSLLDAAVDLARQAFPEASQQTLLNSFTLADRALRFHRKPREKSKPEEPEVDPVLVTMHRIEKERHSHLTAAQAWLPTLWNLIPALDGVRDRLAGSPEVQERLTTIRNALDSIHGHLKRDLSKAERPAAFKDLSEEDSVKIAKASLPRAPLRKP